MNMSSTTLKPSGFYGIDSNREVIRVHVKKCDGLMQPEEKKFSLDPQITSFEMLQSILARAFDIQSDFTISYLSEDNGQEVYLTMLSDWDMDAAFQNASDPCLRLKVDLKPFDESLEDWDFVTPVEIPQYRIGNFLYKSSFLGNLTGTISNQMEKTMSHVQKAIGLKTEEDQTYKPMKAPMTDLEFRNYLDSDGHMVKPEEFRLSIYQGGVEHSLRRVVWRHLLNIFPEELSGRERFDYMKKKENEYLVLRDKWRDLFNSGQASEEAKHVASLVRKDVMRTDRTHKYYSGTDDNKNLKSLFHLLVTYALTHPEISYCQGMSDLASPLLVVQKEEAQAYLCFCGLMDRLRSNFLYDGKAITTKLQHLTDLVNFYDPVFGDYLKTHGAEDLFFCYRWLLLEMKREFPFDDSMYMLEVMWSTIPMDPPEGGLPLTDPEYTPSLMSMSPHSPTFSVKQTLYAHLLAKRRHPARDVTCSKSPGTEQLNATNTPSPLASEQNSVPDSESHVTDDNVLSSKAEDTVQSNTCSNSDNKIIPQNSDKSELNQNTDSVRAIKHHGENENDETERDMNLNITSLGNKLKETGFENDKNMLQNGKENEETENGSKTKSSQNSSRRRQEVERYPRLISGSLDSSLSSSEDAVDTETELISSSEPYGETKSSEIVEISESVSDVKQLTENKTRERKTTESEDENHVQFELSLGENDIQTLNEIDNTKKEKIPEIKGSFFSGMRKILSSPKKRLGRPLPVTEASVVSNKPSDKKENAKLDKENSLENSRLNKAVNDKGANEKGKGRNFKKLIIGNNKSSQENDFKNNHSESENGSNHSEEYTLFKINAKNIKQKDKSDSDSGNGSLTRSQNFTESTKVATGTQGDLMISDQTDPKGTGLGETNGNKNVKDELKNKINVGAMTTSCPEFRENHFDMLNDNGQDDGIIADCAEANDDMEVRLNSLKQLPPPEEFGFGNPFLMFLCLTVLIQHKDFIMKNGMEYDELAMHFDRMVRKHNVNKVLHQTRILYSDYIRMQQKLRTEMLDAEQLNV